MIHPTELDSITATLEKSLTPKRFHHTLGVVALATELALNNQIDLHRTVLAALLHDCAKGFARDRIDDLMTLASAYMEEEDHDYPALLHGPVGAAAAQQLYGVSDDDVLRAIAYHSTGLPGMTPIMMVLVAADYCDPTRDFPGLNEARDAVRHDLRNGVCYILNKKVDYLRSNSMVPHSRVLKTIQSLQC